LAIFVDGTIDKWRPAAAQKQLEIDQNPATFLLLDPSPVVGLLTAILDKSRELKASYIPLNARCGIHFNLTALAIYLEAVNLPLPTSSR